MTDDEKIVIAKSIRVHDLEQIAAIIRDDPEFGEASMRLLTGTAQSIRRDLNEAPDDVVILIAKLAQTALIEIALEMDGEPCP